MVIFQTFIHFVVYKAMQKMCKEQSSLRHNLLQEVKTGQIAILFNQKNK